jgi:hypothetical protein
VSVGQAHDTASFAVASLQRWWEVVGQQGYPQAEQLLICAGGHTSLPMYAQPGIHGGEKHIQPQPPTQICKTSVHLNRKEKGDLKGIFFISFNKAFLGKNDEDIVT